MQANREILVSWKNIKQDIPFLLFKNIFHGIYIYTFNINIEDVEFKLNNIFSYHCTRHFDSILVISPKDNSLECVTFWKLFFEYIAYGYEYIIKIENNKENIKYLYEKLKEFTSLSKDSLVLDFACGTGLSKELIKDVRLLGVDASKSMSRIANSKGLETLTIKNLNNHICRYDAIFCSYALHICNDEETLSVLWNSLKIGKPFVANFHKGIGVKYVNGFIRKKKGAIIKIKNNKHGKCYAYIKK